MTPKDEQHATEIAILGFLLSRGSIDQTESTFATCPAEAFQHIETRAIAEAVQACVNNGTSPDLVAVIVRLKAQGKLAAVGGAGVVSEIALNHGSDILTESSLLDSAAALAAEHNRQQAQAQLSVVLHQLRAPGVPTESIADVLRKTADTLDSDGRSGNSLFNPLSGADLLSLPRQMWRVKDLFPQHGTAVIYGPSRAGKTFAALDLVLSLAEGETWFGWQTVECDILYLGLESTWGLQSRLRAWNIEKGKALPQNLRFIIDPFDLGNKLHVKAISAIAPKNGVLVVDTLNRASPGADENSSRDMSTIIKAVDDISRAMEGLVILISHSGKDAAKGLRGHSSLFAALDASIEIGRNGDTRFIKIDKVKESEDGAKKYFRLKTVVIGTDDEGEDITSCIVEPVDEGEVGKDENKPLTKSQLFALENFHSTLKQEKASGIHLEVWRKHFYAEHFADGTAAKKIAFQRARKELVEIGKLSVFNDVYKWPDGTERNNVSQMFRTLNP